MSIANEIKPHEAKAEAQSEGEGSMSPTREGRRAHGSAVLVGILIAADHLIAHISSNPLITPPLDDSPERVQALATYIESMKRTREMPAEIVLSGHGEPITDHAALIEERLAKTERRKEKVYGLIAEEDSRA